MQEQSTTSQLQDLASRLRSMANGTENHRYYSENPAQTLMKIYHNLAQLTETVATLSQEIDALKSSRSSPANLTEVDIATHMTLLSRMVEDLKSIGQPGRIFFEIRLDGTGQLSSSMTTSIDVLPTLYGPEPVTAGPLGNTALE